MKTEDKIFKFVVNALNKEGLFNSKVYAKMPNKEWKGIYDKVAKEIKKKYLK